MRPYVVLEDKKDVSALGCWAGFAAHFPDVIGFTRFGDFFLQNPETGQIAILYTIEPDLMPTSFTSVTAFVGEMLADEEIEEELLRPADLERLGSRLGEPGPEEVFIPEPYPFLGGSGELESYAKGDVWVFADVVGQLQGIG